MLVGRRWWQVLAEVSGTRQTILKIVPSRITVTKMSHRGESFMSVDHAGFRVPTPVDQIAQFGVQNVGFAHTFRRLFNFFFEFRLETGEFKEKVKKVFLWTKASQHGYFCCTPTGLPGGDFSGFYYIFFYRKHVNDVPFFGEELCSLRVRSYNFSKIDDFSENCTLELTYLSFKFFVAGLITESPRPSKPAAKT